MMIYPNILSIANPYQAILTDAYGVFWDGNQIIDGSIQAFKQLFQSNKIIGVLSNSSQPSFKEIQKYHQAGLKLGEHYHFLLTSGDIAKSFFSTHQLPFPLIHNAYWLLFGDHPKWGSPHQFIFSQSSIKQTLNLDRADFIYASIPHLQGEDQTDPGVFRSEIEQLASSGKPLVCVNPDRLAQSGHPDHFVVRQGCIADFYQAAGGKVYYFGKPHAIAYKHALEQFQQFNITDPTQILMVGDTPETDILGANLAGMPSALVINTGNAKREIEQSDLHQFLSRLNQLSKPKYLLSRLG